jgi:branched-chain amino acid transport system permease protein
MRENDKHSVLITVASVVFILILPQIITNEYHIHILQNIGMVCVLAFGLNILFGYTGQISLGHAGIYAIGAYTTALLSVKLGFSPWIGIFCAMVVSALFGLLLAGPALRVRGPYLAMVTIAFGLAIERAATEWQSLTGGPQGITSIPRPSLGGYVFGSKAYLYLIITLCIVFFFFMKNIVGSRWGRAFIGLSESEVAAESLGVNVYKYKVLSFVISAIYAGLAGALFAHQNEYINSEIFTLDLSIFFLIVVLFGGLATITGPIIGSIALVISQQLFNKLYDYHLFFYGSILLFTLMVLPEGVAGGVKKLFNSKNKAKTDSMMSSLKNGEAPDFIKVNQSGSNSENILECEKVSRFFGGIKANIEIDIDVKRNSIHALIGPNGSGKSTFLNVVSGFYKPTSGSVLFNHSKISDMTSNEIARVGVGRTFQGVQIFDNMTVLENVKVGFHPHTSINIAKCLLSLPAFRKEEKWVEQEAMKIMDFLGLTDYAQHAAKNLSHGHQRLLGIARALALKPKILLLDEPAAGLVQQEITFLKDLIRKIRSIGITVLLVEHHMDLVMDVSDRVSVLVYGEKIAEGTPKEIQNNEKVIQAYLGTKEI